MKAVLRLICRQDPTLRAKRGRDARRTRETRDGQLDAGFEFLTIALEGSA